MQHLVAQVLLPVVLAAIILGMGLSLTVKDFARVATQPKSSLLGLSLQILFLPLLALLIIAILPLTPVASAGLFLVSLCPGGATSNLFSYISRGDVALSVSLTAVGSVLSPFLLPMLFFTYLEHSGGAINEFSLPLLPAIKQLALVTLLPVAIGMSIRHFAPTWSAKAQPIVKRLSTIAMILIILTLMATNVNVMRGMLSFNALAVLLLSTISMLLAFWIAGRAGLSVQAQRTIGIEVGVQNAGTAMLVALAILHQPPLAVIPLMYGLLMNIPAFSFVAWIQKQDQTKTVSVTPEA
ncbi:MAG: bile acid:sodium symporter family protein [Reinekea sp.]|jgi:bile acid:Na+ symporter, BASS family